MSDIIIRGASHLSFVSNDLQNQFLNEISILQDLLKQRLKEETDEQTKHEINEITEASKPKKINDDIIYC